MSKFQKLSKKKPDSIESNGVMPSIEQSSISIVQEEKKKEQQKMEESRMFEDEEQQFLPIYKKKILVKNNDRFDDDSDSDDKTQFLSKDGYYQKIDEQGKSVVENIRGYQKEIFMNSYKQNSIVYLETGTGKTMVGAMLIYYFFKKQKKEEKKKKIIFVANTVQLIEQQYAEIRSNLKVISQKMEDDKDIKEVLSFEKKPNYRREFDQDSQITKVHGHFKGKENLKMQERFSKSKWDAIKDQYEIIVAMGQVLLNGLRRGFIHIDEIEVIIFDECHHARGDHSYNLIMYEFYHFYKKRNELAKADDQKVELPKIYGLTASPVLDVEIKLKDFDILKYKIRDLCSNLDSQFAPYNIKEAKKYIKETNIQVQSYDEETHIEERALQVLQEKIQGEKWISLCEENNEKELLEFYKDFLTFKVSHYDNLHQMNKIIVSELEKLITCDSLQLDAQLGKYAVSLFFKDINKELQKTKSFQHDQEKMGELQRKFEKQTNNFASIYIKDERFVSKKFKFLYKQLLDAMQADRQKFNDHKIEIQYDKDTFLRQNKEKEYEDFVKKNQSMILIFVQEKIIIKYLRQVLEHWMIDQDNGINESDHLFRYKKVVCLTGQSNVYENKKKNFLNNLFVSPEFQSNDDYKRALDMYENLSKKIDYEDDDGELDDLDRLKQQIGDHQLSSSRLTLVTFDFEVQKQTENIEAFRRKELQIILSTSVTEEGFDIPSCNLVIQFNQIQNLKSFVQIKGRARKENSKFLILARNKEKELDQKQLIDSYKDLVEQTKILAPKEEKQSIREREDYKYKISRTTGAILNTNWSVMLFHSYANILHYDSDWLIKGPFFYYIETANVGYVCQIILPPSASSERRFFWSDLQKTKEMAKKDACFKAVIILFRQFKIFNEKAMIHPANYENPEDEKLVKILAKYTQNEYDEKQKYKKVYFQSVMGECFRASFFIPLSLQIKGYKVQIYHFKFNNQQNKMPRDGFSKKYQSEMGFIHSTERPIKHNIRYYLQIHKQDVYVDLIYQKEIFIQEEEYNRLMKINRFLNSVALGKDIEFYSQLTQQDMNRNGKIYKESKKVDNYLLEYKFDNSEGFNAMITLLKQDENGHYVINYEHIIEIEKYINYMSDVYKIRNKTYLNAEEKQLRKKMNKNDNNEIDLFAEYKTKPHYDCVNLFDSAQTQDSWNAREKLVLQNITSGKHFNRYLFYDCIKYRDMQQQCQEKPAQQELWRKIEKQKRQTEGEEINFTIRPDHMILKIQLFDKKYLRKQVNHYLQRNDILQEDAEKLGDFKYFPHQFAIFPMNIDLLMKLKIFQISFLYQVRDTFAIHHFQQIRLPKILQKAYKRVPSEDTPYTLNQQPHFIVEHHQPLLEVMKKDQKYYLIAQKYNKNNLPQLNEGLQPIQVSPYNSIQMTYESYLEQIKLLELSELMKTMTSVEYGVNNKEQSLERYEFLGDTVLKCLASTQIYFKYEKQMERYLHVYRTKIIFNKNLSQCAIKKKLFKYILADKFEKYQPLGIKYDMEPISESVLPADQEPKNGKNVMDEYEIADLKQKQMEEGEGQIKKNVFTFEKFTNFSREIKSKTHADNLESLVGVFYWQNKDISCCQYLLYALGVLSQPDLTFKHIFDKNLRHSKFSNPFYQQLKNVETKLGYTFHNVNLLFQAFTLPDFEKICVEIPQFNDTQIKKCVQLTENLNSIDPSQLYKSSDDWSLKNAGSQDNYPDNLQLCNLSNQRLEFLGDAVLDLIVVESLFQKFPTADPGNLTAMKTQIVQNRTLCLANLDSEFYTYIIGNIQKNGQDIEKLKSKIPEFKQDISKMYSTEYNQTLIKTLGDVIESLVCAIFIDNNLNYEATKKIVLRFMQPFIDHFTSSEQLYKNPQSQVNHVLKENFKDVGQLELKRDEMDVEQDRPDRVKYSLISQAQGDILLSCYALDDLDALDQMTQQLQKLYKKK